MKKILLVNPIYNPGNIPFNIPLSKIAAGLEACGIEFKTVDFVRPDCEGNDLSFFIRAEKEFLKEIELLVPFVDAVYITSGTGNELKPYPIYPRIFLIAKTVKNIKKIPVIVGGALINLYSKVYNLPDAFLRGKFIDCIVTGNEYINFMKIFIEGEFPRSVSPLWNIWEMEKYPVYKSVQYHIGCPYNCDFCFEGKIYDPNENMDRVEDFNSSIGEGERIIIEDSVLMSYQDFDEIMDCLERKHVKFAAYARISEIVKEPQKVERLYKAGCQCVIIGIETLDNEVLKGHNKNIVSSQTREGLEILKSNNINIQGCFMLGFPEDSLKNMENTISFAIDEKLSGYRWHIYQPNYSAIDNKFYSTRSISVFDHLSVQLNVPDNCLPEIMVSQPEIGKLDEHFMIRGKNFLGSDAFAGIGYSNSFSYQDIKKLIDDMFPTDWILNEECLYKYLFY